MYRRDALTDGEIYHVYNRGAHKGLLYTNEEDYRRFQILLYLLNTDQSIVVRDILKQYIGPSYGGVFGHERNDNRLVDVCAYSLMPNHFHLVLRQLQENGITLFLKKLATSYSMYFNAKYDHSGVLFQGRFKSSHVATEEYFRWIYAYVHLNPIELIVPGWEDLGIADPEKVRKYIQKYAYSSYPDFAGSKREESSIISGEVPGFLSDQNDLDELLKDFATHSHA